MKILALQLKRIGDLVLTTPALAALRAAWPEAQIALAVAPGCAPLLAAIPSINAGVVLGKGRGFAPWQQVLTGAWDVCLDFTGTDRSALAAGLSRAQERVAFEWVRKSKLRAAAFNRFVDSVVRERHTTDHYLDLVEGVIAGGAHRPSARRVAGPGTRVECSTQAQPALALPVTARAAAGEVLAAHGVTGPFAVLHPGTARPEKYWLPERWAEVAKHLRETHGLSSVITGGSEPFELAHVAQIGGAGVNLAGQIDLLTFAAVLERAKICVSCDTGAVHLAAAFQTPQVALFGPTNPFHWRPRHTRALVLSAAQPDAPLMTFTPRLKGAPMERISTAAVNRAIDSLLAP